MALALFLAWLFWIPLPFGSVVAGARLPLIVPPIALCAAAAALRLAAMKEHGVAGRPPMAWRLLFAGAVALLATGAMQMLPLPEPAVRFVSPESHAIWSRAGAIAALAGIEPPRFRLSVDPMATGGETLRMLGLLAAFGTASLLVRNHRRRVALAVVLSAAGVFEAVYGLREAALQRYEIWGWVNRLIFDRVTGTFVNPNHFAHYLAIVLPLPLFLVATQWHRAGPPDAPIGPRLAALFEKGALSTGLALLAALTCAGGLLLAQSRGALLSLSVGVLAAVAVMRGRPIARVMAAGMAGAVLFVALVAFLGPERTIRRFVPTGEEVDTLVGRRIGISTAAAVWQRFPITGSGLGTFARVVSMEQREALDRIFHHAHNDYLEILATAGLAGGGIAALAFGGAVAALLRMTSGPRSEQITRRRRSWQLAALASLVTAMVHSFFDFNFFIPSNPATLAAIVGAAVTSLNHDFRAPVPGSPSDTASRRQPRDHEMRSRR